MSAAVSKPAATFKPVADDRPVFRPRTIMPAEQVALAQKLFSKRIAQDAARRGKAKTRDR